MASTNDATTVPLYIDGTFIDNFSTGTISTSNYSGVDEFILGAELDSAGDPPNDWFKGYIAEFRVYKEALTANEISALANINVSGNSPTTHISGDQISTGKIKSNNWTGVGSTVGSLFDLNKGTAHMGGSGSGAKFYFDGADLSLSGDVTAATGAIGGWTIANSQLTGSSVSKIAT